jgi:hypothetical protein
VTSIRSGWPRVDAVHSNAVSVLGMLGKADHMMHQRAYTFQVTTLVTTAAARTPQLRPTPFPSQRESTWQTRHH